MDQDGNVKLKEGEATSNIGTELPQQSPVYAQPVQQPMVQEYNPMRQGEIAFMNQMQQSMTQPMYAQNPMVQIVNNQWFPTTNGTNW